MKKITTIEQANDGIVVRVELIDECSENVVLDMTCIRMPDSMFPKPFQQEMAARFATVNSFIRSECKDTSK